MITAGPSPIQISGLEYTCYCKMPVKELVALPEGERDRAWTHILQHTTEGAAK